MRNLQSCKLPHLQHQVQIRYIILYTTVILMHIVTDVYQWHKFNLRLRGRRLKVNIIFVSVIIALANESITTNGFTSWSVSVMISSLNDYRKPLLNYVGSLSLSNITTRAIEMTGFTIHQKSEFSARYSQFRLPILMETGII